MASETNSSGTPPNGGTPPAATGITPEQLHHAVEKARFEERDKLRTQLDTAREAADRFKADLEAANGKLTKLSDELAALKAAAKPDGGIDVAKAIEQAVMAASARHATETGQRIAELEQQLAAERSVRNQLTLEQKKAQWIAEAGGSTALIPELVRGSTEEEIRASIEESKSIFQRTITNARPASHSQSGSDGNQGAGVSNPPVVMLPNAGHNSGAPAPNGGGVSVRSMSNADYAKVRADLKKQAAARYSQANPVQG